MASINGHIAVMPLTDLLQWVDMCKKTGTIIVNSYGNEKKIFVEKGKIVYVSSNKEGERLGEFIQRGSHLEIEKIKSALFQSQTMKVSFTKRLIDLNYFTKAQLTVLIIIYAKELLLDAFSWKEGWFEFIQDFLPPYIINGIIQLNTTELIFEVFKMLEAMNKGLKKQT